MKNFLIKYRELISYGFWGVATTLVNYAVYFLCTRAVKLDPLAANVIAWAVSVAFAYVVNKLFVFASRSWERLVVFREVWQFVSARLFSGVLETAGIFLFVTTLHFHDGVVKVIAGAAVILLNYVLSKCVIFRK